MIWRSTVRCQGVRCDRIRVIRMQLMIHASKAEHNRKTKGVFHFDTIHEMEIVEELSSALSRELYTAEIEKTEEEERVALLWENDISEKMYDT